MKKGHHFIDSNKLYHPNDLSLARNNDKYHQKIWNQKVQQAKHIQQQKKIDKMFQCLIKQRLFGNFLQQDTRLSVQGYHTIQKINKNNTNPPKLPSPRKIFPLKNQQQFSRITRRSKYNTIDFVDGSINESRNSQKKQKKSFQLERKTKRNFYTPKLIVMSKLSQFPNHFRLMINNKTAMIYDLKIGRQGIMRHCKEGNLVSQSALQKFLFFFNYPGMINFRQYSNWLESVANSTNRQISFFIFQCLDESHNGFLTISDLFRALQNFPGNNNILQKQIYDIKQLIKVKTQDLNGVREIKATVEQFLVKNHTLKLQLLRDLLKHENQDLIPASCVKSTVYHKSMYALEHDPNVRQKNNQLQYANNDNNEITNKTMKQDGLRYSDFAQLYSGKKSIIFCLIMHLLSGEQASLFE